MNRRRWLGLALIVLVDTLVVYLTGLPSTVRAGVRPDAPAGAGWLRSDGSRILDFEGRTVILHGFNDDALLDWTDYDHRTAPVDEQDAALMQAAGFNVVRLPIAWSKLEPVRGRVDAAYLDRIQQVVRMFERHHLWVILDMHFGIAWGPKSGIPAWASLPAVPDVKWFPSEPYRDSTSPQQLADAAYFWLTDDWKQDLFTCWRAVASRFADDPGLAGYDLLNEPHPMPIPARTFERNFLFPFYGRLIGQIASVDPRHLFVVEGTLFSVFPTWTEPLVAPNLVYSPHLYTGSLIQSPLSSTPLTESIPAEIDRRLGEAAELPAPMWVGEMGVDLSSADAGLYATTVLDTLDQAGSGWAWWQWRQWGSWGIRSPSGSDYDRQYLRYLARPYLAAAPKSARLVEADGVRGDLLASMPAEPAGGTLEIAWSALTLAAPVVRGSCVLDWAYDPATARITVHLGATACDVAVAQAGNPIP